MTKEVSTSDGRQWLASGCACALLLGLAVLFRVDGLDSLPGVNGDEAWMGVQALALLHGEPVAWRTPTGNVLNPFHFGPQVLLHALGEPSIARLRTTALLSGLLAIALNFWLAQRVFDARVAIVSSTLLALLPVNIAYARFGWDASQSVLFTLPVVYLPLLAIRERKRRYWLLALISFAAALLVHPTNVFVAPMWIVPWAAQFWPSRFKSSGRTDRRVMLAAASLMLIAGTTGITLLWHPWLQMAATRLVTPSQWSAFAALYLDFLSGTSVYGFIGGAAGDGIIAPASRLLVIGVLFTAAVGWLRQWRRGEHSQRALLGSLGLGYLLTLLGFFLVAGPEAIQPHFERYAMCLIAPVVTITAVGLREWLFMPPAPRSVFARWTALALGAVWLISFHVHYLSHIRNSGGQSHLAFRTSKIDPKEAALNQIVAASEPDTPVAVVAGQWWNYWPLKYFAYRWPHVEVTGLHEAERMAAKIAATHAPGQVWFVEFHDTPEQVAVQARLRSAGFLVEEMLINDHDGTPVVAVSRPTPAGPH